MLQNKEGGEPAVPVWGGEELLDLLIPGSGNGIGGAYYEANGNGGNGGEDAYAGSDNHYYDSDLQA